MQSTVQAIIKSVATLKSSKKALKIAFFTEAGVPVVPNVFEAVVTGSAIGTVGKSTTAPLPAANSFVPVKFTNGNSAAAVTLTFATGGAKAILLGGTAPTANELVVAANGVVVFWYDGTNLHQLGAVTVTA